MDKTLLEYYFKLFIWPPGLWLRSNKYQQCVKLTGCVVQITDTNNIINKESYPIYHNVSAPVMISNMCQMPFYRYYNFIKLQLSAKAWCFVACSRSPPSFCFDKVDTWLCSSLNSSCAVQFRHLMWPCRSKSNPLDPLVVENWQTWWRSLVRKTFDFADEMKGKLSVVCLLL